METHIGSTHILKERVKRQRNKIGRRIINKICPHCGNKFSVTSQSPRKIFCTISCGLYFNNKRDISREKFEEAVNNTIGLESICTYLNKSAYYIYRCEKWYGIKYKRKQQSLIRSDGYFHYNNQYNHRNIYETKHNIKLLPNEGVHHIDNEKSNNNINNLFKTNSVAEHAKIHKSMEKVGFELFKRGYIGFDKEKKEYFIIENKLV
jgi:hypothetical protein